MAEEKHVREITTVICAEKRIVAFSAKCSYCGTEINARIPVSEEMINAFSGEEEAKHLTNFVEACAHEILSRAEAFESTCQMVGAFAMLNSLYNDED